jgi:hypothetical protein
LPLNLTAYEREWGTGKNQRGYYPNCCLKNTVAIWFLIFRCQGRVSYCDILLSLPGVPSAPGGVFKFQ